LKNQSAGDRLIAPIGVFDSGLGGLTVARALRQKLPNEDILYFGDTARVPYGVKSPETVIRFARECFTFLIRRRIKLLVVACNTASALALPVLEESLNIPCVGVILPGVAAALRSNRGGPIGVVGTEATIGSGAYKNGLEAKAPRISVVQNPCPLFVPLAEEGWTEGEIPEKVARHYLAPLLAHHIDTLILGCTHYPMLRDVISHVVGDEIQLVDSAEETSRATAAMLGSLSLLNPQQDTGKLQAYVSDSVERFKRIGGAFLGESLDSAAIVDQGDLPWYER
jgi:glutamate racemase